MEIVKKKIKLQTILDTVDGEKVFIPDPSKDYNVKLLLTSTPIDLGIFEPLEDSNATGFTGTTISSAPYTVTGVSDSRLTELEKYVVSNDISVKYVTSTGPESDGLNVSLSTVDETYIYYLSGITYVDDVASSATTFSFTSSGYSSPSFVNQPMIKDDKKSGIIANPIIDNNVFIIRQENTVFENTYRLRNIDNLSDLTYYAGGNHFNIINNT